MHYSVSAVNGCKTLADTPWIYNCNCGSWLCHEIDIRSIVKGVTWVVGEVKKKKYKKIQRPLDDHYQYLKWLIIQSSRRLMQQTLPLQFHTNIRGAVSSWHSGIMEFIVCFFFLPFTISWIISQFQGYWASNTKQSCWNIFSRYRKFIVMVRKMADAWYVYVLWYL